MAPAAMAISPMQPLQAAQPHAVRVSDISMEVDREPETFEERLANDAHLIPEECLLLPKAPFEGEPAIRPGEVQLLEMEDEEEARTQLILNEDGTVTHGNTEGPPPVGVCGLWQCGSKEFQMTLARTFPQGKAWTG